MNKKSLRKFFFILFGLQTSLASDFVSAHSLNRALVEQPASQCEPTAIAATEEKPTQTPANIQKVSSNQNLHRAKIHLQARGRRLLKTMTKLIRPTIYASAALLGGTLLLGFLHILRQLVCRIIFEIQLHIQFRNITSMWHRRR